MVKGVIVVCSEIKNKLDINILREFLNENSDFHLCFVNTKRRNLNFSIIEDLEYESEGKISTINIRKNKSIVYAIKAGARFLFNRKDIESIGYVNGKTLNDLELFINKIKSICEDNSLSIQGFRKNINGQSERELIRSLIH